MEILELVEFFGSEDKIKHISLSAIIFVLGFALRYFGKINAHWKQALFYAMRDAILIGVLKEITDGLGFGDPDLSDIVADLIGLMFPVYIFVAYRETMKICKTPLFEQAGDVSQAIVQQSSVAIEEAAESLASYVEYRLMYALSFFAPHIVSKRDLWEHRNEALNDACDAQSAAKRSMTSLHYGLLFLLDSVLTFAIDFVKMPFWVLGRTIYLLFEAILFAWDRFKAK